MNLASSDARLSYWTADMRERRARGAGDTTELRRVAEDRLAIRRETEDEKVQTLQYTDGLAGRPARRYLVVDDVAYPETARHVRDAQDGWHYQGDVRTGTSHSFHKDAMILPAPWELGQDLTVDRPGADARRDAALADVPPVPGRDRDEYPNAMFREGGDGASVKYIDPSDNRGSGAALQGQMRRYQYHDGDVITLVAG